jgi:tetratricopeptide (TPR) repeat protein
MAAVEPTPHSPGRSPEGRPRPAAAAVAAAVFAVGFALFSLADFVGDYCAGRHSLRSLELATHLAPGNSDYHSQLGRYLQVTNGDLQRALQEYQTAARLNPQDAATWFEIARLEQVLGNPAEQGRALERAMRAAPKKPDVAWEAANFLLLRGERDQAMQEFRVVLENDPYSVGPALDLLWRVEPDAGALLDKVIPANPDTYRAFLVLLMSKENSEAAAKVWSALVGLQQQFPPRTGLGYVDYLLTHRQPEQARDAWQQMAPLCGLTAYLPSQNLIVNPRFELDVLNAGFDWHYYERSDVKITLDESAPGGSHAVLVTFAGPGITETGLFQVVAVAPNTQYQFSVHFKTDELEGAGGPAFVVRDELTGTIYLTTEALKNPGSWREITGHFETGPDAKLISVRIVRIPPGNAIRGHLWMDEVQLVRLQL